MITAVKRIAPLVVLYAARRYFHDWGATKGERGLRFPGDELVGSPVAQMTEAVWVDAPASTVWPWLVQFGQDRGGLYLPEELGGLLGLNFRNANQIHPKWQRVAVGDPVAVAPAGWLGRPDQVALVVAEAVPDQCLVLRTDHDGAAGVVLSFLLVPHGDDRTRLLLRIRAALRHPGEVVGMELIRPAAALGARAVLRGIKKHAERPHLMAVAQVPAAGPS